MATMATASMSSLVAPAGLRAGRLPSQAALPPRRRALQVVRAQSPKPPADPTEEDMTIDTTPSSPSSSPANNTKPGLLDALAFSGPGPERINGRLAMVGFVSALAVEASRGVGLLSQAGDSAGLTWFAYTAVVLSAASLAPLLQGESAEGRSGGFWNADAELWNGRLAMVGLVALAATEYLTGSPLISA